MAHPAITPAVTRTAYAARCAHAAQRSATIVPAPGRASTSTLARASAAASRTTARPSLLPGIGSLAEEVFGMPVTLTHAQNVSGITSAFQNPRYSAAIGLVKYGQAVAGDRGGPSFIETITRLFRGRAGRNA